MDWIFPDDKILLKENNAYDDPEQPNLNSPTSKKQRGFKKKCVIFAFGGTGICVVLLGLFAWNIYLTYNQTHINGPGNDINENNATTPVTRNESQQRYHLPQEVKVDTDDLRNGLQEFINFIQNKKARNEDTSKLGKKIQEVEKIINKTSEHVEMTRKEFQHKYHDRQEAEAANDEHLIGISKRMNKTNERVEMTRKEFEQKSQVLQEAAAANGENIIGISKRLQVVENYFKNRKAHDEDTTNLGKELQEVEMNINKTNERVEMTRKEFEQEYHVLQEVEAATDDDIINLGKKLRQVEMIINKTNVHVENSFSVGFQAFLHVDVSSLDNDKVQFDYEVNINLGNGYNRWSGIFTVPPGKGGLYYFNTFLQFDDDESGEFRLVVGGVTRCWIRGDDNGDDNHFDSGSCETLQHLEPGDTAYVGRHNTKYPIKYATFTGFLLKSDA